MFLRTTLTIAAICLFVATVPPSARAQMPLGEPGLSAAYHIGDHRKDATSVVEHFVVTLGLSDAWKGAEGQWLQLEATKKNGDRFSVWALCQGPPTNSQYTVFRYLLQEGTSVPVEYRHAVTEFAVLPTNGARSFLFPIAAPDVEAAWPLPAAVTYLGHRYERSDITKGQLQLPAEPVVRHLRPDVLTGVPHNTRQVDETRRHDGSDYEYVPLTEDDFKTMIDAGLNCFSADAAQAECFDNAGVFYWGGGSEMPYPECLYRPLYIGPALFLDEPSVHVRDYVLRARFKEDESLRRSVTPQLAMAELEKLYAETIANGAPAQFIKGLAGRTDVDLGTMTFVQPNIYSWETMVSSAAYELLFHPETPDAIVFEPPGRLGTRRTLPEMNMSFGCQIPVTGSDHFIDIIIGFVRGAARVSGKQWGISTYGGVDRTESAAFISRAYECGATRFFYWDSAMTACVPFTEVLDRTRHLSALAKDYPDRDLPRLLRAAEVAILLPPGYSLGHVHMGKGPLWGLPELNLERVNREGKTYRTVMGNFFTEIERCIRQGVAFDLLWDLPQVKIEEQGYREVVRVLEDGKVEVMTGGQTTIKDGPRIPDRPAGDAPQLEVTLSDASGTAPCAIVVSAKIREGSAPVYYAPLPDDNGVHQKLQVLWEVYGPNEEDYAFRGPEVDFAPATIEGYGEFKAEATLHFSRPGTYRLRAVTTDLAGRSTVVWKELEIR
jgi:hypothetical protein